MKSSLPEFRAIKIRSVESQPADWIAVLHQLLPDVIVTFCHSSKGFKEWLIRYRGTFFTFAQYPHATRTEHYRHLGEFQHKAITALVQCGLALEIDAHFIVAQRLAEGREHRVEAQAAIFRAKDFFSGFKVTDGVEAIISSLSSLLAQQDRLIESYASVMMVDEHIEDIKNNTLVATEWNPRLNRDIEIDVASLIEECLARGGGVIEQDTTGRYVAYYENEGFPTWQSVAARFLVDPTQFPVRSPQ